MRSRIALFSCSVNEDSILKIKFNRTGVVLFYSGQHTIEYPADDEMFSKSISYFGEIPSEFAGKYLTDLRKK